MTSLKKVISDKKKLVIGINNVITSLKSGDLKEVFVSSNFHKEEEIKRMADLFNTKVSKLKENGEEIGAACKKPFVISIIGLRK